MMRSSDPKRRVLAAAAARPVRTRAEGSRRALVVYAATALAMLVLFEAAGGAGHAKGRPEAITYVIALGAAVITIAATIVAVARRRSMVGPSNVVLVAACVAVPALVFAWLVSWHGHYVEPFARVGWRCLALTMMMGVLPLGATMALRKRTLTRSFAAHGATFGATSGAWAGVLVDLWCPLTNARHVAIGHIAPIVLLTIVGALAGLVALRIRPR